MTDPGHADPGHADPGHADPGHADPGHADPGHAARLWTDRSFLRDVQYKTDVNLAARQSMISSASSGYRVRNR
jgi:hypothetical protein